MKTANIFADIFTRRTTGEKRMYTINALTLDTVKIVLRGTKLNLDVSGTEEDCNAGFLRRANGTGCYGGTDGYIPTAKGYRAIIAMLK